MIVAAIVIILAITLFLIFKKKPEFCCSIMGKANLEARELEPVDSKHTKGQNIDSYDQRGESYEQDKKGIGEDYYYDQGREYNDDQRRGDNYYYGEENSYDQEGSYYYA